MQVWENLSLKDMARSAGTCKDFAEHAKNTRSDLRTLKLPPGAPPDTIRPFQDTDCVHLALNNAKAPLRHPGRLALEKQKEPRCDHLARCMASSATGRLLACVAMFCRPSAEVFYSAPDRLGLCRPQWRGCAWHGASLREGDQGEAAQGSHPELSSSSCHRCRLKRTRCWRAASECPGPEPVQICSRAACRALLWCHPNAAVRPSSPASIGFAVLSGVTSSMKH